MRAVLMYVSIVSLSLLVGVSVTHAQIAGISGSEASLITIPAYPKPFTDVTIEINAYTINTTGADIKWFIDGKEKVGQRNERSLSLSMGGMGDTVTVKAQITPIGGGPMTLTKTISATDVDIVVEAHTTVPNFYEGRALPSAQSSIRAIAIPHIGGTFAPSTASYEWKLDNTVLFGGPLKGKQAVDIELPLFGNGTLAVVVYDKNGSPIASREVQVPIVTPELHFYENSPLRGLQAKAITGAVTLVGDEMSFKAEPYYLDARPSSDLKVGWQLDGLDISNASQNPYELTLRKTGGSGQVDVGFVMTNARKVFQNLKNSFTMYFEG